MLEFFTPPVEVPGMLLRTLVALAFTGAAAYFDMFNNKWVPNYLIYGFLAAALALNVLYFEQTVFVQAMVFGIVVFGATYLLYRTGQLGGADAYVLTSIALCLPYLTKPFLTDPQHPPYPFILSVLAPTGLAFILHMMARFLPYVSKKLANGEIKFTLWKILGPSALLAFFSFFIIVISSLPVALPMQYIAILSFLFVSLFFFTLFKDEIKDSMIETVAIASLQEEDVLAIEKMNGALVKRLALQPLITKQTIASLKKTGLKKVPVYTGMPFFLPYLFFGLAFSLLFGDMIHYLVSR